MSNTFKIKDISNDIRKEMSLLHLSDSCNNKDEWHGVLAYIQNKMFTEEESNNRRDGL